MTTHKPLMAIIIIAISLAMITSVSATNRQQAFGAKLVTVGDIDCDRGLNNAKTIRSLGLPFIELGDIWYRTKCIKALSNVIDDIKKRYSVIGNHELEDKKFKEAYTKLFKINGKGLSTGAYWKITMDGVMYIGTNIYVNFKKGSNQYNKIQEWCSNPTSDKIIALVHTPLFAPEGAKAGGGHDPNTAFRSVYGPVFDRCGVDAVFSGDDHIYGYYDRDGSTWDQVICGQGGRGGDTIAQDKLKPFQFAKSLPNRVGGYCITEFLDSDHLKVEFFDQKKNLLKGVVLAS